ncbi:addiction module toxin RelE [Candidatus Pacearchaeota archaeon]|nr:addiction module toxin RelE [Candidatus Pacearchaeota archaeon]
MYNFKLSKELERVLDKLIKKDKQLYEQVLKKIDEVVNSSDIEHYKNLKYDFKDRKRVHVGHFVLTFVFNKQDNLILFQDFDHHDNIYRR